jgi:dipeptidyl aminopeptidase/acylaminoacyl peptidase
VSVPEGTLFRAAADGSQRLQLTWPPLNVSMPHWSSDGKQIAFFAAVSGKPERIYIVPADGGAPQQITNGEAGIHGDWDPSWAPDGATLAFGATNIDEPGDESIHVVDMKTHRITTLPGSKGMWSPRWSPDGHSIAGHSNFEGRGLVLANSYTFTMTNPGGASGSAIVRQNVSAARRISTQQAGVGLQSPRTIRWSSHAASEPAISMPWLGNCHERARRRSAQEPDSADRDTKPRVGRRFARIPRSRTTASS